MTSTKEELLGILIPQGELTYLLPNVAIAEIFTLQTLFDKDENSPDWVMGNIEWKNRKLPLLVFNNIIKDTEFALAQHQSAQEPRVAIINSLNKPGPPQYSVFCSKIPKLSRLKASELQDFHYTDDYSNDSLDLSQHINHPSVACCTLHGGELILIPQLIWIEKAIHQHK